jgi:hypothetical protein
MSKPRLIMIVGASLLALAGTASAGGISLTDKQMRVVTAGASGFDFSKRLNSTTNNTVNFDGLTNIKDTFSKKANIDIKSHVTGNSASLAFDNEAIGKNSNAQGSFSQETIAGQGSSQSGLFVSAANGTLRTNDMRAK